MHTHFFMQAATAVLTILGLAIFEIVSSIDNAVINAEILDTMNAKGRRWFLLYGFVIAVVVVRGILPWVIVWAANPGLGLVGALTATFSGDPTVAASIAHSSPVLLAGGGVFLAFLFLHWLFLEKKRIGLQHEKFFERNGVWFYVVVLLILVAVVGGVEQASHSLAFGAVFGAAAFFFMQGFKLNAERAEEKMKKGGTRSDISKILYLEIIDASFSIDGILGAFAFTLSVPYILIGNGIGAYVLRKLTVKNIETIQKYAFLKMGAMYAIAALSLVMLLGAFGHKAPEWVSPVVMLCIVGFFFLKSKNTTR